MVYGMARQSGGTARIDSRPGEGTTVKLYFRAAEEDAAPADADGAAGEPRATAEPRAGVGAGDRRRPRRARLHRREPRGAGLSRARGERRRATASTRSPREKPDLVILDFIMPGLSGAEVANRILRERPDQPILFVSGYSETEAVSAPRPKRRCWPSRSAPTRSTRRCAER